MTKRELEERRHMMNALESLGFTFEERNALRRISMTLHSWFERECGTGNGCIERDDETGKAYWLNSHSMKRYPIRDLEKGAMKRLAAILARCNDKRVCKNCEQWIHDSSNDCLHDCRQRGFAPDSRITAYTQTDPRGAALYILRPSDVPAGQDASGFYTRGICVY